MTRRLVKFLVSGFGPFLGVDRNPTQSLVEYLASRTGPEGALLSSGCEDELIQVLGTAVMRVSAEDVDAHLAQLVAVLQQEADIPRAAVSVPCAGSRPAATAPTAPAASGNSTAPVRSFSSPYVGASSTRGSSIVLLHLGVANTATTYRLESRAYNCATFRVPDANGWSPQRQELESGRPGGLEGWVGSALPLEEMAKELTAKGHGDVLVSTNAGRFICNWCYYRSCRHVMQIEEQSAPSVAAPLAPLPCGGDKGGSGGAAGGSIAASGSGASSCNAYNAAATATAASATAAGGSTTPATAAARSGGSNSCSGCSNDGGRGTQRRWHSLFIHVPPFSVYDEDAQRAFLIDAIREVAARVTAFDNGLDAQLEQQQRGGSCYGDGAGGGEVAAAAATTAETAAAAAHDSADPGGGFGRLRPTVVQGTGLPEPSPEQLLEQQQRMLLPVVTVAGTAAALEDASAGDGVGVGVNVLEITDGR